MEAWQQGIEVRPIGVVRSPRTEATDDDWAPVQSTVDLDTDRLGADATAGLDGFSHVEVVFVFDRVDEAAVAPAARHPRAHRLAARRHPRPAGQGPPNRIGVTRLRADGGRRSAPRSAASTPSTARPCST